MLKLKAVSLVQFQTIISIKISHASNLFRSFLT